MDVSYMEIVPTDRYGSRVKLSSATRWCAEHLWCRRRCSVTGGNGGPMTPAADGDGAVKAPVPSSALDRTQIASKKTGTSVAGIREATGAPTGTICAGVEREGAGVYALERRSALQPTAL